MFNYDNRNENGSVTFRPCACASTSCLPRPQCGSPLGCLTLLGTFCSSCPYSRQHTFDETFTSSFRHVGVRSRAVSRQKEKAKKAKRVKASIELATYIIEAHPFEIRCGTSWSMAHGVACLERVATTSKATKRQSDRLSRQLPNTRLLVRNP